MKKNTEEEIMKRIQGKIIIAFIIIRRKNVRWVNED